MSPMPRACVMSHPVPKTKVLGLAKVCDFKKGFPQEQPHSGLWVAGSSLSRGGSWPHVDTWTRGRGDEQTTSSSSWGGRILIACGTGLQGLLFR